MAFKRSNVSSQKFDNPIELFRSLSSREYQTEMPHQRAMIEAYVGDAIKDKDVALQLPTGSGKTLVGLLIGEWRRTKFNEKVVYLCPTKQLVNQTVEQAQKKYGMDVLSFTGSRQNYSPTDRTKYNTGQSIAVTTYSSLFNTNPFFNDADIIIIDDAHAAENYIASMWSVEIPIHEYDALHTALRSIIKPHLQPLDFKRLCGEEQSISDASWVDKLPSNILIDIQGQLLDIMDEHTPETQLEYPWSLLRDHISSCHLYMTSKNILIRPIIPPTWSHSPFENAKQRIFMSATLGEGGDLERLTGREKIKRISIPDDFELQGVGRRFFMFPGMSLEKEEIDTLRLSLMERAGRSVVLTTSSLEQRKFEEDISQQINFPTFSAEDIEDSKENFTCEDKAVAVLANRYDGIDFPMDEARLLCVDGLPKAMNAQERFFMSRMGATVIFNERISTRVFQAIGRCNRAILDRATIFITGDEIQDYITHTERRGCFYPSLQAELDFGIEQSTDVTADNFLDNFDLFLSDNSDWRSADQDITQNAKMKAKSTFPCIDELSKGVIHEVRYQKYMWQQDYVKATEEAQAVLGKLQASDLKGYRGLWHYLAGQAARHAAAAGHSTFEGVAREQLIHAQKSVSSLPWLNRLIIPKEAKGIIENKADTETNVQVEALEQILCNLGTAHDGKFTKIEKEILEGLTNLKSFENSQKKLGELLGFNAGKIEDQGSPDPWWLGQSCGIVFEDYVEAKSSSKINTTKARQAASHIEWMKSNVPEAEEMSIISVLVSPVTSADKGAKPSLTKVSFWALADYITWAKNALSVLRELRSSLSEIGDLAWRAEAIQKLEQHGLTMKCLTKKLSNNIAANTLTI